jgi:Repeat of unknown function (DUF346)
VGIGYIDVFGRGGDGALWQRSFYETWSYWKPLDGRIAPGTGPAACSVDVYARLDVFVVGMDNALWHKWYVGGMWSSWEALGGGLTSSPAATARDTDTRLPMNVFVRGTDGNLWGVETLNGGTSWGPWNKPIGPPT